MPVVVEAGEEPLDRLLAATPPAPELHERSVDDDAVEPCRQPGRAREAVDRTEGREEGFLDHIPGLILSADEPPRGREHAAAVLPDQRLERLRVTPTEAVDERLIAIGTRRRGWPRGPLVLLPQKLGEEARATSEAGPSPREAAEQGNPRRIDELEAGDVQPQRPLLGDDGFARHSKFLHGLVREPTFDAKGRARRDPRDPHHREGPPRQATCRPPSRSARQQKTLGETETWGRAPGREGATMWPRYFEDLREFRETRVLREC